MAVKKLKPTTPGQRFKIANGFDALLLISLKRAYLKVIKSLVDVIIMVE